MGRELMCRLTFEWKFRSTKPYVPLYYPVSTQLWQYSLSLMGYAGLLFLLYIACTYSTFSAVRIGKHDHLWQSNFWSNRPLLAAKNGPLDQVWFAKFGPARTAVGKGGPFLAAKIGPGRPFLAPKISPGDHVWRNKDTWQSASQLICFLIHIILHLI